MRRSQDRGTVVAYWTFVAVAVVALPIIVFGLGDHRWFHGDEFGYIFERDTTVLADYFRPGNAHWSTVPILLYRGMYEIFGLQSYWPYQLLVVAMHVTVSCLMRVIMRRSGVDPWIATAAATAFVFFGAGAPNIIWGFQIGFNAALIFGFVQLIASDHQGPIRRRDVLGLAAGLLAIMSAGVGVIAVVTVGIAALLRRGWKVAAFHTAPLAAIYLTWVALADPDTSSGLGNPPLTEYAKWVWNGELGLFVDLGGYAVVSWLLAAAVIIGVVLAWRDPPDRLRPVLPIAMALGSALFLATACFGRWIFGVDEARNGRFVHIVAAFALPFIALALTAFASRFGPAGIAAGALLLLVGIVPGHRSFSDGIFNERFYDQQERVVRTVTRVPEATLVSPEVRPLTDPLAGRFIDVGHLEQAVADGKLSETTFPITAEIREEMKARLVLLVDREPPPLAAEACPSSSGPVLAALTTGDVIRTTSPFRLTTVDADGNTLSNGVVFRDGRSQNYTVQLDDVRLQFAPAAGRKEVEVCLP